MCGVFSVPVSVFVYAFEGLCLCGCACVCVCVFVSGQNVLTCGPDGHYRTKTNTFKGN